MAFTNDSKHKARAFGRVVLGKSGKKETPFVETYFKVTEGDNVGGEVRWTGYFTENSSERTIEALQTCGWEGDDVGEFADGELHGLDKNEVLIVVELEEYEKDGEKHLAPRVKWVNKLGGYLNVQNAMPKEEAASFGEKMKGLVLKMKTKKAAPPSEAGSFDFGANAKPEEPQKKVSGTKKGW